jgi:hypothetical protein
MESMAESPVDAKPLRAEPGPVGRGRRLTLGVAIAATAVFAVWIWGLRSLEGLPDVGEPFDVAQALRRIDIPEADNAYVGFLEARQALGRQPTSLSRVDLAKLSWGEAGPTVREYVEQNRPALAKWRDGTECPGAVYNQPGQLAFDTLLPVVQDLRTLAALAGLEGSRLEEQGKMEEAWTWYRGMLRSSRHVGTHGVIIERLVGARLHEMAARRILHWAGDPRVDAVLLRRAFDDTLAADALTVPISECLKLEYLMCLRDLQELRILAEEVPMPGGRFGWFEQMVSKTGQKKPLQQIRLRASNDVERSRRVLRLVFANWLAQMDRPVGKRAPIATKKPTVIYRADPTAPWAARALSPEDLDRVIDHTLYARQIFRPEGSGFMGGGMFASAAAWEGDGLLALEPRRRALLIVKLAAELYRREHGKPPSTAGQLVGACLKSLPEEIAPDEPIPAADK